jgi:hypothetical protein
MGPMCCGTSEIWVAQCSILIVHLAIPLGMDCQCLSLSDPDPGLSLCCSCDPMGAMPSLDPNPTRDPPDYVLLCTICCSLIIVGPCLRVQAGLNTGLLNPAAVQPIKPLLGLTVLKDFFRHAPILAPSGNYGIPLLIQQPQLALVAS